MKTIQDISEAIRQRSKSSRAAYLSMISASRAMPPASGRLSCSNWAHVVAANSAQEKNEITSGRVNLGIVTAYNDMLSAHQPFEKYPNIIKLAARNLGANAQVAGGVPAMCDGVTQGLAGMELSLFSRDVIAMATAVSLSHNVYDGVVCLGVCDKIAPGMLIGALQFGHLPTVFIPAGPMPSGIPNKEKAAMRQRFAAGEIDESELLETEMKSYHSPGTCTFYGTANTNQVVLEGLGVQLAGTSFINPHTKLRLALTEDSVKRVLNMTDKGEQYTPLADVITESSIVNAIVLMMATGGSTNLSLHLIAMAAAAGIQINWADMDEISKITPLLAKVYPNGQADVNHFEQAGGLAYLVGQLRSVNLLNEDVVNVMGHGLDSYVCKPEFEEGKLSWLKPVSKCLDETILSTIENPFSEEGGMRVVSGELGTGIVKVSAVDAKHHVIEAPCKIFSSQDELRIAFKNGELDCDHVSVVRFQGPAANGMPELHKLTPFLAIQQDKGFKVALVTDGRMSGASGKILAAIHVSPEAKLGGMLAYLQEGDIITVDARKGELCTNLSEDELRKRKPANPPTDDPTIGRGLFANMRNAVSISTAGASVFQHEDEGK